MIDTFKHKGQRERLVQALIQKGITDDRLLKALETVPRHAFVEGAFSAQAYQDKALPIKRGQTISQPFTVAFQTQLLQLRSKMKVLEVGTGSGYQAAILCEMGMRVFSVEYDKKLHEDAGERLSDLQYAAHLLYGDGSQGWQKYQPYDRILVTAASPGIPESLKQQLAIGGRMVIPVGTRSRQRMTVVKRIDRMEYEIEALHAFQFVPLRGKFGFEEE